NPDWRHDRPRFKSPGRPQAARRRGRDRMVVGRADGCGRAFRCVRDCGLLYPLRRQAARLCGEVWLPACGELRRTFGRRRNRAVTTPPPNGVPPATTRMAAEAGKHVFLDKPIANTVDEGREIARICDAAGVVLALGYQRRRENHFRWIKAEIDAGRF